MIQVHPKTLTGMEREIPKETLSSATRPMKRSHHPLQSTSYDAASEHRGCKFKTLLFLIWKKILKSFPGSSITASVPGSTRGTLSWSTATQETGYAWPCLHCSVQRAGQSGTAGLTGTVPRACFPSGTFTLETATWSDPNQTLRVSREPSRQRAQIQGWSPSLLCW